MGSIDVSQLYQIDQDSTLLYYDAVRSFEYFAMSAEGEAYIRAHAEADFKLRGLVLEELNIRVREAGVFHQIGINISFQVENLSEHPHLNAYPEHSVTGHTACYWDKTPGQELEPCFTVLGTIPVSSNGGGRPRRRGLGTIFTKRDLDKLRIVLTFDQKEERSRDIRHVAIDVDTWFHEVAYHGAMYELAFIRNRQLFESESIPYPFNRDEVTQDMLEDMLYRAARNRHNKTLFEMRPYGSWDETNYWVYLSRYGPPENIPNSVEPAVSVCLQAGRLRGYVFSRRFCQNVVEGSMRDWSIYPQ